MHRLRVAVAPIPFAVRRVRERPLAFVVGTLAFAAAAALIGWSSLAAALAQERSVRLRLAERPQAERAIRVFSYTQPLETDSRATTIAGAIATFRDVTDRPRRVTIWHPIAPPDERGVRLVVPANPAQDVELTAGRLPAQCGDRTCEALALAGRFRLGQRVRLGQTTARVVGLGALQPEVLPGRADLGSRALLVRSLSGRLQTLAAAAGSTVVTTAVLDPARVHGFRVRELSERIRTGLVRLERSAPPGFVRANAPLPLLDRLADRGEVARDRLLLVAGQAAALVLAFAAFGATTRRRERLLVDEQLGTLGASRAQTATVRTIEALVPSAAGALLAVAGVSVAARIAGDRRGLPGGFVAAALPLETLMTIAAVAVAGGALLLVAGTRPRRSRLGIGPIEVAAVVALGVVVWQASTTGALDADRIAAGERTSPVLLLVPALAFFATGVLLLRVVPLALRAAERGARRAPIGLRLSLLAAARNPAQTAAATTFLAVALGSALFSLDYRATLERQTRDDADFAAGARWRVVERGAGAAAFVNDVTPLTRFAAATRERPTPVFRLDGTVVGARSSLLPVRVLALPAARIPELRGWHEDFASFTRAEVATRLRPWPVRLAGPKLAPDARGLRVWARAKTDFPRVVVLHFLLPGQSFEHVRLGFAWRKWRLLRVPIGKSLANAQLVGVELVPTTVPVDFKYDPRGYVDLGRIEQRRAGGWSALPPLDRWKEAKSPDGTSGILAPWQFDRAPVPRGIRFELNGTFQPLIHPKLGLPDALPGYEIGAIPALASGPVAAQAVDGLLSLGLTGKQIPIRIVGRAQRFPTVVARPRQFVVLDYDTLFAALNADRPGLAAPSEAWFFRPQRPDFAASLAKPPFRLKRAVGVEPLRARLTNDPLAAGTKDLLTLAGAVAAALGLAGLVLATRAALEGERLALAEYEAMGVPPRVLRRSMQARLLLLSALGIAAGLLGALLAVRLVGATVAVTGAATRPILPIEPVVPWPALAAVVLALAAAAAFAAALLTERAMRETAARRLRA